jgi:hypothetical protein
MLRSFDDRSEASHWSLSSIEVRTEHIANFVNQQLEYHAAFCVRKGPG